jgi:hypothetical protein
MVVPFSLTTGEMAWVSDEDADLTRLSWQRSTHGHLQRNLRHGKGRRSNQELARTIMERLLARPLSPADIVEHVDGDLLNNQRENLRLLGKSALRQRDPLRQNNTSGYTGVSYDRKRHLWKAYISQQGKRTHLGRFPTATQAALAYNEAALRYFGDHARLNVIASDPGERFASLQDEDV